MPGLTIEQLLIDTHKLRKIPNQANLVKFVRSSASPRSKTLLIEGEAFGTALYQEYIQFYSVPFNVIETSTHSIPVKLSGDFVVYMGALLIPVNPVQVRCSCFTGDTLIPLVAGYSLPIKDLVGKSEFFVYSYSHKLSKIVVGRGHSARKTGTQEKIIKITFDNSSSVRVTSDHLFMLKDGSYKKAGELTTDDSLMPLYREPHDHNWCPGYETVIQPDGGYQLTHHLSDEFNLKYNRSSYMSSVSDKWVFKPLSECSLDKFHRHHIDFNKYNNVPTNIVRISRSDHFEAHYEKNSGLTSPEVLEANRERLRTDNPMWNPETIKKKVETDRKSGLHEYFRKRLLDPETNPALKRTDPELYDRYAKLITFFTDELNTHGEIEITTKATLDKLHDRYPDIVVSSGCNLLRDIKIALAEEWFDEDISIHPRSIPKRLVKGKITSNYDRLTVFERSVYDFIKDKIVAVRELLITDDIAAVFTCKPSGLSSYVQRLIDYGLLKCHIEKDDWKNADGGRVAAKYRIVNEEYNHRIVKIEDAGYEDVYCFTVDDYGNYAIDLDNGAQFSSGVFVHNCPDFKFTWSWYDNKEGALLGRPFKPYVRKTSTRPPRNPIRTPGLCKHLIGLVQVLQQKGILR